MHRKRNTKNTIWKRPGTFVHPRNVHKPCLVDRSESSIQVLLPRADDEENTTISWALKLQLSGKNGGFPRYSHDIPKMARSSNIF